MLLILWCVVCGVQSAPVPATNDGPVLEVVADAFDALVLNSDKVLSLYVCNYMYVFFFVCVNIY